MGSFHFVTDVMMELTETSSFLKGILEVCIVIPVGIISTYRRELVEIVEHSRLGVMKEYFL